MEIPGEEYKVWTWKSIYGLHWIINPGVAFAELLLGARVPKVTLVKKDPSKSLPERSFVPCPHCGVIHPSTEWSAQNKTAFGNWFGLYCSNCGKTIPCLWNLTSLIVLGVTFPIWGFFNNKWKQKWLTVQKKKFSKRLRLELGEYNVWLHGLKFCVVYYFLTLILKYAIFLEGFVWKSLIGNLVSSLLIGFISAATVKEIFYKKKTGRR